MDDVYFQNVVMKTDTYRTNNFLPKLFSLFRLCNRLNDYSFFLENMRIIDGLCGTPFNAILVYFIL